MLRRDLPRDVWRDPSEHAPPSAGNAFQRLLTFSNFCIAGEEIGGLAWRCGQALLARHKPIRRQSHEDKPGSYGADCPANRADVGSMRIAKRLRSSAGAEPAATGAEPAIAGAARPIASRAEIR